MLSRTGDAGAAGRSGFGRSVVRRLVMTSMAALMVVAGVLAVSPAGSAQRRTTTVPTTMPTTTSAPVSTLAPIDCRQKRQILARYERQKARAATNAARADQRSKQAERSGNAALADALQGVIDEQEERIEIIQAAIDAVKVRCK